MPRERSKKLTIRLSDNEYKEIVQKLTIAKKQHHSIFKTYTDYIMYCIKSFSINVIKTEIIEKELKAIGKNINQWTKNVNTYNEVEKEDVEKLEKEIVKIWQLLKSLKNEIKVNMENIPSKTK